MSIIKKLLGGPDYFVKADGASPAGAKPVVNEPAKAPAVESSPESVVTSNEMTVTETVAVDAPAKTKKRGKRKAQGAKPAEVVVADPSPGAEATTAMTNVQALVDAALAQASAEAARQSGEGAGARTFATDYLLVNSMKGRRTPGPSLTGFIEMAGSMRR